MFKTLEESIKSMEAKFEANLENMLIERNVYQENLNKIVEELRAKVQIVERNMCIAELEKVSQKAMKKYHELASQLPSLCQQITALESQLPSLCQQITALENTSTSLVANMKDVDTRLDTCFFFVDTKLANASESMDLKLQAATESFNGASTHVNEMDAQLLCRLDDFQKRQDELSDHVKKALCAANTIDGKVKAFDMMERRLDELLQNTQAFIKSYSAGTTKCLFLWSWGSSG